MDFLRIRDKAKRARAAEDGRPQEPAAGAPATRAPDPLPAAQERDVPGPGRPEPVEGRTDAPADLPAASEADALEGALAARLQGLPPAADPRFATWRPGVGAPPDVPPSPSAPGDRLDASDFALVRPTHTSAREPFLPPFRTRQPRDPDPLPAAVISPVPAPSNDPLDDFLYRDDEDAPAMPGFEGVGAALLPITADATEEYITFLLGAEEYAVAIERVREVLRCPPLTEVPRAPAHVRGVVSVRGEVVAVVDPRRRLGLPEGGGGPQAARLLVVDVGDGPVGLLVDAVSSVVRLQPGSIEPCPQGIGGPSQEYLAGIGRESNRLFTVLDLGALLRRAVPGRRRAEGPPRAG